MPHGLLDRQASRRSFPTQALAMVLLRDRTPPDPERVFAWLRAEWPDSPSILNTETRGGATTSTIRGGTLGFLHVPLPVPPGELDRPVAAAWHWPGAALAAVGHESHVICYASSTVLEPVGLRVLHTRLVAALAATSGACGVYVGSAVLLRGSADWIEEAREATGTELPILLWIGLNPVVGPGGASAYTTGLRDFGLLEFEVRDSVHSPTQVLDRLADIAHYAVSTGTQIEDGHTVGGNEEEHIEVRHGPSAFLPDQVVARLGL